MKQAWTVEYRNWIGASNHGLLFLRARHGRGKWRKADQIPPYVAQYIHLDRGAVPGQWHLSGITEKVLREGGRVTFAKRIPGRIYCHIDAPVREVAKNYERTYEPKTIGRTLRDYDGPWHLYRCKYKYTDCGPSLGIETSHETLYCDSLPKEWNELKGRVKAIHVSSIVEGVDIECETRRVLCYPLGTLADRLDAAITEVDEEASYIWSQTHGCPECKTTGEWGHDAINPNCKACKGEGVIL